MSPEILEALLQWAASFGVVVPEGLKFTYSDLKGILCVCEKEMDEPKIKIPPEIIISRSLPIKCFKLHESTGNINGWLKLFLAKIKFDKYNDTIVDNVCVNKKFKPYLDALPLQLNSPLIWNSSELECLASTNLGNSIHEKFANIFKEWFELITSSDIFDLEKVADDIQIYRTLDGMAYEALYERILKRTELQTPTIWYSFSAFLWSQLIFTSRAFPEYVVNGKCPENSIVLLPIIDLLNHDYRSKVKWYPENGWFCYEKMGTVAQGQELFNNYGGKGNEELLSGYGFVLEDNIFDSVALKIKLPLDVISAILEKEPLLKLPTLSDYTTFAFEDKNSNRQDGEAARDATDYADGVTYFINTQNEQSLEPLLNLFTYLSKTEEETLHDLRARFEGIQMLRNALESKLNNILGATPIDSSNINSYRYYCADIYRKSQKQILKESVARLKRLEKTMLSENKNRLLTMNKILKNDPAFTETELPSLFSSEDDEELVFESTYDLLVLWVLVKARCQSFPTKYQWVGQQYISSGNTAYISDDSKAFHAQYFGKQDNVDLKQVDHAIQFVGANSFTRASSTSGDTILVRK
ncbi:protein-lysine N-methyltransferase [Saccharomyces eubayanus]|uniref:protein-lysine N-methyltransferase n=1 Tax=Saccharomyces eubayanus TaxID=1080349 RepID=UPI0006C0FE78|nr:RKM1-like protein [Saccharomyces eubayanus]KOG96114.1 RKM1-like protein [Saccharomyces eubayanus]